MVKFLDEEQTGQTGRLTTTRGRVGRLTFPGSPPVIKAFLWKNGGDPILLVDGDTEVDNGTARAVNDAETVQVAGGYSNGTGFEFALAWFEWRHCSDNSTLAAGLREQQSRRQQRPGYVVGRAAFGGSAHAVMWTFEDDEYEFVDLNALPDCEFEPTLVEARH